MSQVELLGLDVPVVITQMIPEKFVYSDFENYLQTTDQLVDFSQTNLKTKYHTVWQNRNIGIDNQMLHIVKCMENAIRDNIGCKQLFLNEIWGAVYTQNDYCIAHHHNSCDIAAVWYPGEINSEIEFLNFFYISNREEVLYSHKPNQYDLLLFPGFLSHRVNRCDKNGRTVVAANFNINVQSINLKKRKYPNECF